MASFALLGNFITRLAFLKVTMPFYVRIPYPDKLPILIGTGLIIDGAWLGFVLAKFQYVNFWGIFCNPDRQGLFAAAPGECYWYINSMRDRIGIILHLATCLPAGLLVVFQFIPIVRYKGITYHRIAGYVIILLVLVTYAGALMIARHSFGGDYTTQAFVGILVILTSVSLALAIINIKRLQIDQHRAWMLRAWAYFGTVLTIRLIQFAAAAIASNTGDGPSHQAVYCPQIQFTNKLNDTQLYEQYPGCDPANSRFAPDGYVVIDASLTNAHSAIEAGALLQLTFGMAGVVALLIHIVLIELYLNLTPRETERLRQVSYERQIERGFKNPGSAGLTADRFGDADPWVPQSQKVSTREKIIPASGSESDLASL
jgi:uncharacterized membrane protein